MIIECPVSLGELVDKISILKIKTIKIPDESKKKLALEEHEHLLKKLESLKLEGIQQFLDELFTINSKLWVIEDDIRLKEKNQAFDNEFIKLARAVYQTNDQRFAVKAKCNQHYGSQLQEVKSYESY
jgi:hypothetical protein